MLQSRKWSRFKHRYPVSLNMKDLATIYYEMLLTKITFLLYPDYIDGLLQATMQFYMDGGTQSSTSNVPGPLSSTYDKPDKASAIKSHRSHFSLLQH